MPTNAARAATLASALRAGVEGDHQTLRAAFAADVCAWTPAVSVSSRAELLDHLDRRDDAFSIDDVELTPLDVGGAFAAVEWTVTMTHTGPLELHELTMEATGIEVTLNGVTVAEFRGHLICSLRQYWDEFSVLEQLGALTGGDR